MRLEEKKVGKHTFVVATSQDFEKWLLTKMSNYEFGKLSIKGKREIFLNWKWGTAGIEGNESAEQSEQVILRTIREYSPEDWTKMSLEDKDWYERKEKWGDQCFKIWKDIESEQDLKTKDIQRVADTFEGRVT